jgi:hypothetical protein
MDAEAALDILGRPQWSLRRSRRNARCSLSLAA